MPDRDRMMALNAKPWRDSDSERQTRDAALNAKLKTWLWKPNWEDMVTLNAKLRTDIPEFQT